jgi:hypothetical protein
MEIQETQSSERRGKYVLVIDTREFNINDIALQTEGTEVWRAMSLILNSRVSITRLFPIYVREAVLGTGGVSYGRYRRSPV